MRTSPKAERPLELLASWLNQAPLPLVQAFHGMGAARVVMAGVQLGLFARLADGPRTAAEFAAPEGLEPHAVELILRALEEQGVVRADAGGSFRFVGRLAKWLSPRSPDYVGDFLAFNQHQWDWWGRLHEAAKAGAPAFDLHQWPPEDPRWLQYVKAMHQLARFCAAEVAAKIPVPRGATRLLDVAGSHGAFSVALRKRHPRLEATILELPGAARVAARLFAADGLRWVEGDALAAPLPACDVTLCFQLTGHLSEAQRRALFAALFAALPKGGVAAVLDHYTPDGGASDGAALVALNYFLVSRTPRLRVGQVRAELEAAGFAGVRVHRVLRSLGQTLLVATKRP